MATNSPPLSSTCFANLSVASGVMVEHSTNSLPRTSPARILSKHSSTACCPERHDHTMSARATASSSVSMASACPNRAACSVAVADVRFHKMMGFSSRPFCTRFLLIA